VIELLEQLTSSDAETADFVIFVELFEELPDGDVKFSKAVETTITQTTEKPIAPR